MPYATWALVHVGIEVGEPREDPKSRTINAEPGGVSADCAPSSKVVIIPDAPIPAARAGWQGPSSHKTKNTNPSTASRLSKLKSICLLDPPRGLGKHQVRVWDAK